MNTLDADVLEIFRAALKNPSFGPEEDFFAAGGDSLMAVEAVFAISERVGNDVDPMIIFIYPTAAGCAAAVADLVKSTS